MWKLAMALGIAVFLPAGITRAADTDEAEQKASGVHADSPADSSDEGAAGQEAGDEPVTETPPVEPAAPAAVKASAPTPTAFATVNFRNDVGKKLRLVEAQFTMDGEKLPVVLTNVEPGKSYVITSGAVKPGPHVVTARLTYRGDRGVFSYMKGYKLNVKSDQVLTAPADRTVSFTVVGTENPGLTVPLERRLVVRVEENPARK